SARSGARGGRGSSTTRSEPGGRGIMPRCERSGIAGSRSCGTACAKESSTTKRSTWPTGIEPAAGRTWPPEKAVVDKGCLTAHPRSFADRLPELTLSVRGSFRVAVSSDCPTHAALVIRDDIACAHVDALRNDCQGPQALRPHGWGGGKGFSAGRGR